MTTMRALCPSTQRLFACTNSPGDISAGSTCCSVTRRSRTCRSRSMPSPLARVSRVLMLSSKMNIDAWSPLAAHAATNCEATEDLPVLARNQAREHLDAALTDDVVVIAAAKRDAAAFHHHQAPPLRAVLGVELLQTYHTVSDALHLQIVVGAGHVVEQHHRAVAADEELLEREDLPAIAKRVARA